MVQEENIMVHGVAGEHGRCGTREEAGAPMVPTASQVNTIFTRSTTLFCTIGWLRACAGAIGWSGIFWTLIRIVLGVIEFC